MKDIDVFRVDQNTEDATWEFVYLFINSSDFTNNERRAIARTLGQSVENSAAKEDLSSAIATALIDAQNAHRGLARIVMEQLIHRSCTYMAVKLGEIKNFPKAANVERLVFERGEDTWYGPINVDYVHWYVRPFTFKYFDKFVHEDIGVQKINFTIRWLCFARITSDNIAIFWRNFTTGGKDGGHMFLEGHTFTGRFPYWNFVPQLFNELEELCGCKLNTLPLEKLLLHTIWDELRYNANIEWNDIRIRAEHRGVALNAQGTTAQSSTDEEHEEDEDDLSTLDITGIRHLATTIRNVIQKRMLRRYNYTILQDDESYFDEEILRTLIQRYNPKSYRCSIDEITSDTIFSADSFFGKLPKSNSADSFVHMRLWNINKINQLQQLAFILNYYKKSLIEPTNDDDDFNDILKQLSLL